MSVTKATRAAVQAAYDALRVEGIEPTADQIVQMTRGSKTTVCRHLREIGAASPPPATPSIPLSTLPSEEAQVELPREWREAADGLSRTFAHILTRTIAAERERAMQLLEAEAAARGAAVAVAQAEVETLRQTWEKSREQADANFIIAADEVKALQEIIATLLAAVDLEASDDLDDLRAVAGRAINGIRDRTEAAVRVRELEVAAQAAESRIAELSTLAIAGAEAIGRAKALEQVVVHLTGKPHAPTSTAPALARNCSRSAEHAGGAAMETADMVNDVGGTSPAMTTASADQRLPLADLVLAAPPSRDSEAPPTQPVLPASPT
ncbi:DNA-binding protein [Azospirillum thiophilum]|nr:DNA-binding protein [Azospirillum thiophilum]